MEKRNFIEDFKEKTKHMTLKEKLIDYVWEYYKIHIFIVIIVIFLIGSYINDNYINPPNAPYAGVAFFSTSYVQPTTIDTVKSELNQLLVEPESGLEIFVYDFFIDLDNPTVASINAQRFTGMLVAKEIDLVIIEAEDFYAFIEMEAFLPLDNVFSPAEMEQLKDYVVFSGLGIDMEKYNSEFLKNAGADVSNKVFGVISNTVRLDNALEVSRIILK